LDDRVDRRAREHLELDQVVEVARAALRVQLAGRVQRVARGRLREPTPGLQHSSWDRHRVAGVGEERRAIVVDGELEGCVAGEVVAVEHRNPLRVGIGHRELDLPITVTELVDRVDGPIAQVAGVPQAVQILVIDLGELFGVVDGRTRVAGSRDPIAVRVVVAIDRRARALREPVDVEHVLGPELDGVLGVDRSGVILRPHGPVRAASRSEGPIAGDDAAEQVVPAIERPSRVATDPDAGHPRTPVARPRLEAVLMARAWPEIREALPSDDCGREAPPG
jgi:hypothetical protein